MEAIVPLSQLHEDLGRGIYGNEWELLMQLLYRPLHTLLISSLTEGQRRSWPGGGSRGPDPPELPSGVPGPRKT